MLHGDSVRRVLVGLLGLGGWALVVSTEACGSGSTPSPVDASSGAGSSGSSSSGSSSNDAGTTCVTDLDCNGDPEISSMQGECLLGICVCRDPFVVQPSGACGAKPAPDCQAEGGSCAQDPATCPANRLASIGPVNQSCGDLVAAVCCFDRESCRGPSFRCVIPDEVLGDALCVNGWRTCPAGSRPMASDTP